MNKDYSDIINLPHHRPSVRAHMPIKDRAAQFAPFAALPVHDAAIKEKARLTDEKTELTEEMAEELNRAVRTIQKHIDSNPKIKVKYYIADTKKQGGSYAEYEGNIRRIDEVYHMLIFADGKEILMDDIVKIKTYTV